MFSWSWTDTNQIQATAAVMSVVVTLVGFFLLWRQIRQVELTTRAETHGYLYTHQDSITRFFIENSNIRPYFYDNKEVSITDSELGTIRAVTEMIADFSEHIYLQLPNLPKDVQEGWESYMKNLYNRSPALRSHFIDNGSWYGKDFIEKISSNFDGRPDIQKTQTAKNE